MGWVSQGGLLEAVGMVPRGWLWGEQVGRMKVSGRHGVGGWETQIL